MSIVIQNVTKRFGNFVALDNVTLNVPSGSLVALLGPSGSGKTTLLRVIAGLEQPDAGSVDYHGEDVTRQAVRERNVGFVFQHYALFRHMTVFDNIAFGLSVRRRPVSEIRDRVGELLRLVRLENLERRYPAQLSGGQRQRVALARALATDPKVLLLDEPFGALDAKVRRELREWLRRLHDEIHTTSVFVTHDQEEAFEVADEVVVMNRGRIEQQGPPEQVFERPANRFVIDFLGNVNVFHGRVQSGRAVVGSLSLDWPSYHKSESKPAAVYIRPHEMEINRSPSAAAGIEAQVDRITPAGSIVKIGLTAAEHPAGLNVDLPTDRFGELGLKTGEKVWVAPKRIRVFVPEEPEYAI